MLSRFISKSTHLRLLNLISSKPHFLNPNPITHKPLISIPKPYFFPNNPHFFSTGNNNNGNKDSESEPSTSDLWKLSSETEESVFGDDSGASIEDTHFKKSIDDSWGKEEEGKRGVFDEVGKENGGGGDAAEEIWATAEGYKAWSFAAEGDGEAVFDVGEEVVKVEDGMKGFEVEEEKVMSPEDKKQLELEEKALTAVIKGPNRAFGDLIAASGITDEMLDSLMALKDLDGVQGLPPLREIEDMRYEKNTKKSTRADIERQKQEEVAKARVRQVDAKGRAYGTGRRKCSIARVWVEPGDGKFVVNDKEFDVYFPMLDHRAVLLRPFTETKTLGMWDIRCTVKGGGVSGQVGAILLGISRALQNWDPELRPPLRKGGLLTRDSRVVERKKPGKAKARKSFQWVKR